MKQTRLSFMEAIGAAVLAAIATAVVVFLSLPLAFANGWALSIIWGWFVVPVFHVANLPVLHATGLSFAVSHATKQNRSGEKAPSGMEITVLLASAPIAVGAAWLLHCAIGWFQ